MTSGSQQSPDSSSQINECPLSTCLGEQRLLLDDVYQCMVCLQYYQLCDSAIPLSAASAAGCLAASGC